ncbi:hypothetical protein KAI04_04110 [Candidatus Pacearchaeota archaeon]|nr:hypothetical protein [Candidatus Pacearchaeota archaeon]
MKEIDLIKELRNKTLERIIEKHGDGAGSDLKDTMLSIIDVRTILYEESRIIAERVLNEEMNR